MPWSKRDLVLQAFSELGLAKDEFDLQPGELDDARVKLDAMVASWNISGLGYAESDTPGSGDLDQDSGLPDCANEPVYLSLAIRLAPGYGKQVDPNTRIRANQGLQALRSKLHQTPDSQKKRSGYPMGAGNRRWRTFTA